MTDQDPTQRYEPPAATPAPADAPAFAPPAAPDAPDAAGDPVTTSPVAATSRSRGGGSRLRWLGVGALLDNQLLVLNGCGTHLRGIYPCLVTAV